MTMMPWRSEYRMPRQKASISSKPSSVVICRSLVPVLDPLLVLILPWEWEWWDSSDHGVFFSLAAACSLSSCFYHLDRISCCDGRTPLDLGGRLVSWSLRHDSTWKNGLYIVVASLFLNPLILILAAGFNECFWSFRSPCKSGLCMGIIPSCQPDIVLLLSSWIFCPWCCGVGFMLTRQGFGSLPFQCSDVSRHIVNLFVRNPFRNGSVISIRGRASWFPWIPNNLCFFVSSSDEILWRTRADECNFFIERFARLRSDPEEEIWIFIINLAILFNFFCFILMVFTLIVW